MDILSELPFEKNEFKLFRISINNAKLLSLFGLYYARGFRQEN